MLGGGPARKPYALLQAAIGVSLVAAVVYFVGAILLRVEAEHHTMVALTVPFLGVTGIVASLPFMFYAFFSDQFQTRGRRGGPLFSA